MTCTALHLNPNLDLSSIQNPNPSPNLQPQSFPVPDREPDFVSITDFTFIIHLSLTRMKHPSKMMSAQTAEMPGFYQGGEYDVAGFAVGAVKRDAVIDGSAIRDGDAVLALASSGVHSNGFSLVRKVLEARTGADVRI